MNTENLKIFPRAFHGAPSRSSTVRPDGSRYVVISIRDAFLDPKTMASTNQMLLELSEKDDVKIIINSPGGDTSALSLLLSAMKACKATITTHCTGIAASCGAVAWMYGDKRTCSKMGRVMFHGTSTMGAAGNSKELIESLEDRLDTFIELLRPAIEWNILTEEEFDEMINKKSDIYLTYDVLKERGALAA